MSKFVNNPSFCYIAPTKYLEFTKKSATHLVLAHLIIGGDQDYIDFYKARSAAGDLVLCDNSAFELGESFSPDKLIEAALSVGATSLVLPDYPGQSAQKTVDAAEEWIPKFKEAGLSPFFVPQSEVGDLDDWLRAYEWGANNPDVEIIGQSILGIPNALPNVPAYMARVTMATLLRTTGRFNSTKHHHWLGLNAPEEVEALLGMGVVDTLDSSSPVQYGLQGHQYRPHLQGWGVPKKKYIQHVDFSAPYHKQTASIIETNVNIIANIFKQYQK
jgi:hypothetical protein